jgi:hypothetical protein
MNLTPWYAEENMAPLLGDATTVHCLALARLRTARGDA